MSTTPETTSAPETPAASLLFQAPAFQAPTFHEPEPAPVQDDTPGTRERPSRRRRASRAGDEPAPDASDATSDVPGEDEPQARPSRTRRARRPKAAPEEVPSATTEAVAPPEAPEASGESGEEDTAPDESTTEEKSPRRRSRRSRRSRGGDEAPEQAEDAAAEPSGAQGDGDSDDDSSEGGEDGSGSEGSSRRRRRRRSRGGSGSSDSEAGRADLSDQVKALKGSTRLEAKKQRRREGRKDGRRRHVIAESEFLARRESVTRQMVIRHRGGLDQIAILEDDLLVEHYVARRTQQAMVGNIYLGRVQNVLPSMEAAFVDIGRGRNAVLYAGEVNWDAVGLEGRPRRIEAALKSGDTVLVQVTKDPIGHKGARLTSQITLAGRYLVLIPNGSMMGISRKLPENERTRLKKILKKVVPTGSGVIVRTAAEGASEEQLEDDVARLVRQWEDIERKQTNTKAAPVLLRGEPELAVRVVRDIFNEDFSRLVIQGAETYETVKAYIDDLSPELSDRVEPYVGTGDVFHDHRVDEQLAKGMDRKVWLPSGGTLIIDRTEAMTVIDVNTGKYIGAGGTLEETVTRNNLEAAEEIVRQLRLRDIGGIVIVDFVDMVLESNRDLVLRRLVECLGRDRTRHQVTEITSLGLVQMTRKRVGEGLVEAFSTPCEVCEGRGFIVHDEPVEHTGSEDHTGHSAPRRGKKAPEEPRRIDEGPGRERVREAVSAIAAASGHRKDSDEDDEPVGDEGEPVSPEVAEAPVAPRAARTPRRRRAARVASAEPGAGTPEVVTEEPSAPATEEAPEQAAEPAVAPERRPRRRRAAVVTSEEPTAPAAALIELPAPVDHVASTPVSEPHIVLPERPAAPRGDAEETTDASGTAPGIPDAPEGATVTAPARRPRHRRAATASVVDPERAEPAAAVATTAGTAGVHRVTTLADIALPEAEAQEPRRTSRRRRASSGGVVEAGGAD